MFAQPSFLLSSDDSTLYSFRVLLLYACVLHSDEASIPVPCPIPQLQKWAHGRPRLGQLFPGFNDWSSWWTGGSSWSNEFFQDSECAPFLSLQILNWRKEVWNCLLPVFLSLVLPSGQSCLKKKQNEINTKREAETQTAGIL